MKREENNIDNQGVKKKKRKNGVWVPFFCVLLGGVIGFAISFLLWGKTIGTEVKSNVSNSGDSGMVNIDYANHDDEEHFVVETPIVNLYYPEKWEELVDVAHVEGETYIVSFSAKIKGEGEFLIFDIVFGGNEGYSLGYIEDENQGPISVSIVSYDFEPTGEWAESDIDTVYSMIEDVNYLIEMLEKEADFVSFS